MIYDGSKIVALRNAKGWSQAELARRAAIKQPSLWALEHGVTKEPKHSTMLRIANALGVQLRDIMRQPKKGEVVEMTTAMHEIYDQLDDKNKAALLAAAKSLRDTQKQ